MSKFYKLTYIVPKISLNQNKYQNTKDLVHLTSTQASIYVTSFSQLKSLSACVMYLVWNKQTKRLLIYFTCKNLIIFQM